MSNFDLSMSNFLVPGLRNYQPRVGKMKSLGVSLTTLEVVNNMATPYTRVFTMTDGDTVSGPVEADCTVIYRTSASQQLDLTSLKGSPGVKINLILEGTGSLELVLTSGLQQTTYTLTPQASIAQVYPLNSGGIQTGWVVGSSGGSGGGTVGGNIFDAIYPVGSLYWSSKPTNPATLFGGTWTQIKDKFVLACGDTYNNGATGGSANTTLTTANLPSHTHSFTPAGTVSAHSHPLNNHTHSFTPRGTVSAHSHPAGSLVTSNAGDHEHLLCNNSVGDGTLLSNASQTMYRSGGMSDPYDYELAGKTGLLANVGRSSTEGAHTHSITGSTGSFTPTFTGTAGTTGQASGNTANATPTFSGTAGTTSATGSGTAFSNLPPYVVKYCWERTA